MADANEKRVPVTILTGFLGAGKTTLLNRILNENHGKRIAVIENEFGEVGIDHELVIGADEEIFEMNNGCICCTVRGDLIRVLTNLMKRRDRFDYILVETTGLADPGPVAQTFFVDDEIGRQLRLDAIVTLVDARHHAQHMRDAREAAEQVAFADVVVINKTDLVNPEEVDELERSVRAVNPVAKICRAQNAVVAMDRILDVGGFSLDRALDVNPAFMTPEYPFEWRGVFDLKGGETLQLDKGPDPTMKIAVIPWDEEQSAAYGKNDEMAARLFSARAKRVSFGELIKAGNRLNLLDLSLSDHSFPIEVVAPGRFGVYLEHRPEEFNARWSGAKGALLPAFVQRFSGHAHDKEIRSVGIEQEGDLYPKKLNKWLQTLLAENGADILRMKGVLSLRGEDRRFVFQGVHMLFDGKPGRPWAGDIRRNSLVFIGRNLDRQKLNNSFQECLS